jgi:hypothetical protein
MTSTRQTSTSLVALLIVMFTGSGTARATDWRPVTQDELSMTSEPKAPGAPAIYLYMQIDRDDNSPSETRYARIKILTDEGRRYANILIPFFEGFESVRDIQARTIQPDGRVVDFNGAIYDKPIFGGKGIRVLAKTFTLPNVDVGSIIEYRFRHDLRPRHVYNSEWVLSQDLFTKYGKYSLVPYRAFSLRWVYPIGLPEGSVTPRSDHGRIELDVQDVPAFVVEEFMPPETQIKYRVDFIYMGNARPEMNPDVYWKTYGTLRWGEIERFIDQRKAMEQAIAQVVQPGDSAEIKLRKIYARTQELRNVSFEQAKSGEEAERDNPKHRSDVEDVWKQRYGDGHQITWLFLALVRAAGFQADPLLVSGRDKYFFDARRMNPAELNTVAVIVNLDGKDIYLSPGTPFTPFGMLPWDETDVKALRLDKAGGRWIRTVTPAPSDSRIDRKATLQLTDDGALHGQVIFTYTGLEALSRRLRLRNEDAQGRRQYLEDEIKGYVPTGIEVRLTNEPDWTSSDPSLIAEYDIDIPGWVTAAGRRELLPVGLFGGSEKHTFEHAARLHPIYLKFPNRCDDDVTIKLPAALQVSSLPPARSVDRTAFAYSLAAESASGSLHISRRLTMNMLLLDTKNYDALRAFFQTVRVADEDQVVLAAKTAAKAK